MIEISIVIGTYNLKDKLLLVLDSFNKQSVSKNTFEIIVVDSESDDGSKECIMQNKYNFPLNYIVQKNSGKAAARNTGIKSARADLILITDADMIAHKDLVKEHLQLQKKYNNKIIVEGKTFVLIAEKLPIEKHLKKPYITHKVKDEQKLDFYYCLTGNLSMPKKFYEEADYFDEKFENYGWEDVDLGYRLIRKKKKKIIYSDKAINYHFHVWTNYEEMERRKMMGQSVNLLITKHPELKTFLGINAVNFLIYLFLKRNNKLLNKWIDLIKVNRLSRYKKLLLREYFFQKGYRSEN